VAIERFTFFWTGPFSQWHPSPFKLYGFRYSCAEQAMMYAKAIIFADDDVASQIMSCDSPRQMKALGRAVRGFDDAMWNSYRREIVFTINRAKFEQNDDLREQLVATRGTTLVEASPYDRIWGIGLAADDPRALQRSTWQGQNLLGEVLTELRLCWE